MLEQSKNELSHHIREIPSYVIERDAIVQGNSGADSGESSGRSLKDYFQHIIKYRWLITIIAATVLALTALYSFLATPTFTATTTLKISTYAPLLPGASVEDVMVRQSAESDYLNTQVQILSGLSLANRVLAGGGVGSDIRNYLERQSSFFSFLQPIFGLFSRGDLATEDGLNSGEYKFSIKELEKYRDLVAISPVRKTSLVRVSVSLSDRNLAAEMANAHAQAFIDHTRHERQKSTLENLVFLKSQAQELADKVALTERNMASYAEDNAIVSLNKDENIVVKQMAELNALLTESTARRILAESDFREAQSGSGATTAAFDDPSTQEIRVSLKEAQAEYARLSEKFKPAFPRMVQLRARIDALKENLTEQRSQITKGLEAKYNSAVETEKELQEKLEVQKSKAFELSRREVKFNIMRREYESLKDLHQTVLRQLKEAQLSSESRGSNITIADLAAVPLVHSSPKRLLNLVLALLFGPLAGVCVAFLVESLDNTIKTPEEAQRVLNVPALGVVPMFSLDAGEDDFKKRLLNGPPGSGGSPESVDKESKEVVGQGIGDNVPAIALTQELSSELVTLAYPKSIASEAFRAVRTAILLSSADNPPRLVLVTSGQKAEGKTTLVTNLAVTLAQSGHRTLLVDADLRRPALHTRFSASGTEKGLVDYLAGQSSIEDVTFQTEIDNLKIITSGSIPPNPSELLGSRKMAEVLSKLKEDYDYVFVDAPPVLPVTDAVVLSNSVDGVVLVVRGQETQRHVAQDATRKLRQVGAKLLGVVLNDVDIRSGDYYYYRRGYYSYYQDEQDSRKRTTKRAAGY